MTAFPSNNGLPQTNRQDPRVLAIPDPKVYKVINPVDGKEIAIPFQARQVSIFNHSQAICYMRFGSGGGAVDATSADLTVQPRSWLSIPIQSTTSAGVSLAYQLAAAATQFGGSFSSPIQIYFYDYPFGVAGGDLLPLVYRYISLSAVVITSETTIWTPAAGRRFRLMGFHLAQGVVTGAVTLKDNTGGQTIYTIPPNTVGVAIASPSLGAGILSAARGNVLTATGASTETLTGTIWGVEE